MDFPEDVWWHVKTFVFKSAEMKRYDVFVTSFNDRATMVRNLEFRHDPYEQMLYDSWCFAQKFMFLTNFLQWQEAKNYNTNK